MMQYIMCNSLKRGATNNLTRAHRQVLQLIGLWGFQFGASKKEWRFFLKARVKRILFPSRPLLMPARHVSQHRQVRWRTRRVSERTINTSHTSANVRVRHAKSSTAVISFIFCTFGFLYVALSVAGPATWPCDSTRAKSEKLTAVEQP